MKNRSRQNPLQIEELAGEVLRQFPLRKRMRLREVSKTWTSAAKKMPVDPLEAIMTLLECTPPNVIMTTLECALQNSRQCRAALSQLNAINAYRLKNKKSTEENLLLCLLENNLGRPQAAIIALVSIESIPALKLQLKLRNTEQFEIYGRAYHTRPLKSPWEELLYALMTKDVTSIIWTQTDEALSSIEVRSTLGPETYKKLSTCIKFISDALAKRDPVYPCIGIKNLSSATLSNWRPTAKEINLQGANLNNADLKHAELRLANLEGASLTKAILTSSVLYKSNLHFAKLDSAMLDGADLTLVRLTEADLNRASCQQTRFFNTTLNKANLDSANLHGAVFKLAELIEADLSSARFQGAKFDRSNFNKALIRYTNLALASFEACSFNDAQLSGSTLRADMLDMSKPTRNSFAGANLIGNKISGSHDNLNDLCKQQKTIATITDLADAIIHGDIKGSAADALRQALIALMNQEIKAYASDETLIGRQMALTSLCSKLSKQGPYATSELLPIISQWEKIANHHHSFLMLSSSPDTGRLFKLFKQIRTAVETVAAWEQRRAIKPS